MRDWKRTIWLHGGVLLSYALLAGVMTWPVVGRLNTHLVGSGDDMWVHYWNNWWVKKVLAEGGDVYSTRLLFYPQVASLVYHNFGWVNIAGWLMIEPLVGGIAAFNLVYLVNITLCAFAMFALARYLLKSNGPAFIAGLVYGYWPYRLSDYNHPNMISTEWLPLALLCVILLVRERRVRYAVLAGLFLALTGLSRWQMLLPAGIAVGVYLLSSVLFERKCWSRRTVGLLGLAALMAVLLVAVPFYPLARDMVVGKAWGRLQMGEEAAKQTDLLAYFVPPVNHPVAPIFDSLDYAHSPVRFGYSAFIGYAALAMVVVAVVSQGRATRPWIVLALVAFLLSLGPVLRLDSRFYPGIPMPYRLVGWLAPIRWMRYPHRFNTLLALPVAVLAGYGASVLGDQLARRWPALLWGVLSALILFDYFNLPAATVQAAVPEFYAALSQDEGDFAVLDLPMGRDKGDYYMFYQTVHGHPIVEGNTARPQPQMFGFIDGSPLLRALREKKTLENYPDDISRQLTTLADTGVRYIVVHKTFADSSQLEDWRTYFAFSPAYEDDDVSVYRTELEYGREFDLVAELGDGIGIISATLSTDVLPQDGLLEVDLRWGSHAAPTRDWVARLALVSTVVEVVQTAEAEPCSGWPTAAWRDNAVARGEISLRVDPFLAGGSYTVTLALLDPTSGEVGGDPVPLGQVEVQTIERTFEVPDVAVPVEATFGDDLRLLGYDLDQSGESLHLTLHWKALERMETAYKFFVHLYNAESGELVAQKDVMPYGWSYPTTWWEVGEVVSDEIVVSLEGVPGGIYSLAVGVYNADTGERLAIADLPDYLTANQGRLILPEEIVR